MRSRMRAGLHMAIGGLLVLGGWQVAARASAASTPAVISGCYDAPGSGGRDDRGKDGERGKGDDSTGALRIVRAASDCKRGETFIQWNQAGVPGPQGVPGPAGAVGATGPVGPAGVLPSVSCPAGQFLTGIVGGVAQCAGASTPPSGYVLTLLVQGSGTVTSSPPGISCTESGAGCSATFAAGTSVDLFAQAAPGAQLQFWSGTGCTGSTSPLCSVVMNGARSMGATFSIAPPPVGELRVNPADPIIFAAGSTKVYQVQNIGAASTGAISIASASPNFTVVTGPSDGCSGVSLAVGASCTFTVTFTLPAGQAVYWEESALTITAPSAPPVVVPVYAQFPMT